ncbi:MAG: NAD(P)H-hydrate epimerase [Phycisphaerae bacterium]|jgi:NAD(P)H-hydrate epimerase
MDALSRDEVRRIDRTAIEQLGVPGVILMENAGRGATDAIIKLLGSPDGKRVAIVAGGGNNGGDGFVIARHLAIRGVDVTTFLLTPPDKIAGDAAVNLSILRRLGHAIRPLGPRDLVKLAATLVPFDMIVDAIGGTGIRGPLRGEQAAAVEAVNAAHRPVVAVDIPTGLDCDSGAAGGPTIRATLTVTFVAWKKGFDTPGAEAFTGKIIVADIGVPAEVVADLPAKGQ